MYLITMAHLGEAQGVIELFKLKRSTPQLFVGETLSCLITGEGPFEAATATAAQLGSGQYKAVINLGIAGSFSSEYSVGEIYPVRSIYLVIDGKPQFKSFKSHEAGVDCLTSFERILNAEKALPLSGIAELVDREAWGVAMAAKNCSTPFTSYKLVSDLAGTLGACEIVKEKAEIWSQKLALYLQNLITAESAPLEIRELPGFHLTFSTRHQFDQMLNKISLRDGLTPDQVMNSLPLNVLREEIALPKERTRKLLDHMEGRLDPLKEKLKTALLNFKSPFDKKGITLQHDVSWESPELKVIFEVASNEELKEKLKTLEALNLKPFEDLRSGNFHVE
jgi:hypothetical protein